MSYGGLYNQRVDLQAYRATPQPGGGGSGAASWSPYAGAGGGNGSGGEGHSAPPAAGAEAYGFHHTVGLPGFEGAVHAVTGAGAGEGEPAARYLAALCQKSLAEFQAQHSWEPQLLPGAETALRLLALEATPKPCDLHIRLQAMAQLKELARSGIHFCVGLDLEPYGSFVSGLYTPLGDLDLSIEGQASWRDESGRPQQVVVDSMGRDSKVKFLRALASRIQAKRMCQGQVQRILHARVPILKFRDLSGLDFDVGIGGSQALFKSTVVGLLAQYEWRFGALVRLVKLWARKFDVNDSANGTLNSFALTLLVVFHLQTRTPALLPPLCELFGASPGSPRPMQDHALPDWRLLQLACGRLSQLSQQGGSSSGGGASNGNSETLVELLASFFVLLGGLMDGGWAKPHGSGVEADALRGVLRRVRVDTWSGRLRHEAWDRDGYCFSVEDPFDSTDNCARTVRTEDKVAQVADAARLGSRLLLKLEQPRQTEVALARLFGEIVHQRAVQEALLGGAHMPAVQWVPPVDLIIPPRIQVYTHGRLPPTVAVDHLRPRGGEGPQGGAVQQVQQQLAQLELPAQAAEWVPPPLPVPPGLGVSGLPSVPSNGSGGDVPPAAEQLKLLQRQAPSPASLQELLQLMQPEVAEEAARLAEEERKAAEAAAARAGKKAAKKAAKDATRAAAEQQRQQVQVERGRSRSGSRAGSKGGSRSLSGRRSGASSLGPGGGRRSSSRTRAVPAAALPAATGSMAAAAVSNLGGPVGSLSSTSSDGAAAVGQPAATRSLVRLAASSTAVEAATEPASAATGSANGMATDSGGSSGERRFGKGMKAAAEQRKERRSAAGAAASGGTAAAPAPPGLPAAAGPAAASRQRRPLPPPPPPGLAGQQQLIQQEQQAEGRKEKQGRGGRGRGRGARPEAGTAGAGAGAQAAAPGGGGGSLRVLVVQRQGMPAPPPLV